MTEPSQAPYEFRPNHASFLDTHISKKCPSKAKISTLQEFGQNYIKLMENAHPKGKRSFKDRESPLMMRKKSKTSASNSNNNTSAIKFQENSWITQQKCCTVNKKENEERSRSIPNGSAVEDTNSINFNVNIRTVELLNGKEQRQQLLQNSQNNPNSLFSQIYLAKKKDSNKIPKEGRRSNNRAYSMKATNKNAIHLKINTNHNLPNFSKHRQNKRKQTKENENASNIKIQTNSTILPELVSISPHGDLNSKIIKTFNSKNQNDYTTPHLHSSPPSVSPLVTFNTLGDTQTRNPYSCELAKAKSISPSYSGNRTSSLKKIIDSYFQQSRIDSSNTRANIIGTLHGEYTSLNSVRVLPLSCKANYLTTNSSSEKQTGRSSTNKSQKSTNLTLKKTDIGFSKMGIGYRHGSLFENVSGSSYRQGKTGSMVPTGRESSQRLRNPTRQKSFLTSRSYLIKTPASNDPKICNGPDQNNQNEIYDIFDKRKYFPNWLLECEHFKKSCTDYDNKQLPHPSYACLKKIKDRTEEEQLNIIQYLLTIPFFKKYPPTIVSQLARDLSFEKTTQQQTICNYSSQIPSDLFLIVSGKIGMSGEDGKLITILREKDVIGDVSLESKSNEYAYAIALKESCLLRIPQKVFSQCIQKFNLFEQIKIRDYIKDLAFFKQLPENRIQLLSDYFNLRIFNKGDIIATQNKEASFFIIVKEGSVKAEQVIDIQSNVSYPVDSHHWELSKTTKKIKYFLGNLHPGQFVGHSELISKTPLRFTLTVNEDSSEILLMKRDDFYRFMNHHEKQKLLQTMNHIFPTEEDIKKDIKIGNEMRNFKQKVIQNMSPIKKGSISHSHGRTSVGSATPSKTQTSFFHKMGNKFKMNGSIISVKKSKERLNLHLYQKKVVKKENEEIQMSCELIKKLLFNIFIPKMRIVVIKD